MHVRDHDNGYIGIDNIYSRVRLKTELDNFLCDLCCLTENLNHTEDKKQY